MKKKKLAFMLAATEDYIFAVGNIVLSIMKYMPNKDYEFVIYYDQIKDADKKVFKKQGKCSLRKYIMNSNFENTIRKNCPRFNNIEDSKHYNFIKFSKFEAFSLLKEYETVVWLDADISIQGDLSEITKYTPFGITPDTPWKVRNNFIADIPNFDMEKSGVCSAVIVFSDKLPYQECYDFCYKHALKYSAFYNNIDQGIFNLLIQAMNITPSIMDEKVWQCSPADNNAITAKIVHAGGKEKFWNNTNICNSCPEWYRMHLEWLKLGGSDFDQSRISPRSPCGALNHFDRIRPRDNVGKKKLAFLLGITPNLAFAAGNVALSLNRHMSMSDYDIVVYYTELSDKDKEALSKIPHVRLVSFRLPKTFIQTMLANMPNKSRFKSENHLMCFSHFEVFPLLDEYENVAWLDVDTSIQRDLSDIINFKPFGITADEPWTVGNQFSHPIDGYDMNRMGHCTAVMLVNDSLPYKQIHKWLYEKAVFYADSILNPDQAIISIMLQHFNVKVNFMPLEEWQCISWRNGANTARIVHFGNSNKVWSNINVCNAFPEWYRTHLEWLELGGSDFDQKYISPHNVLGALNRLDEFFNEEKKKKNKLIEKIEKIYLFKKIPLYKIKRKGSVRTDYLFGVLPIVRRKKKYRETNESILLDKIGDVNNTLADLLQNACSVTQHQIEKQAILIEKNTKAVQEAVETLRIPTIHFVHCMEFKNQGDMHCCPYFYFKEFFEKFPCRIHDIWNIDYSTIKRDDVVILGGGGMLECLDEFQKSINKLTYICSHVICWGCGHNTHTGRMIQLPIDYSRFELLSVRDYNTSTNERYCPDVSCLMPDLEKTVPITRKIGIITHQDFPIDLPYDQISHKDDMNKILSFIAETDTIVTNTYHCAYWSMCMNKKVILYQPFSTKFNYFKYPPVIYSGNLEEDISKTVTNPDFLSESRKLNLEFFTDVKKIINEIGN